jgi:V-type H+-transporting ATPase subunit a
MMGCFSIYTGLIYNDVFSKSLNIFGSHWTYRDNFTFPLSLSPTFMLDPGNNTQYQQDPYYMGIDPAWQYATNKITFLNG